MKKIIFLILFSISAQASESLEVLSPDAFNDLTPNIQSNYINEIKALWVDFESEFPNELDDQASIFQIFSTAYAETRTCIIGGAVLQSVRSGSRYLCPTMGRSCSSNDSFKCGDICDGACVSRTPIATLSLRCYSANKSKKYSPAQYEKFIRDIHSAYIEVCSKSTAKSATAPCRRLTKRISELASPDSPKFIGPPAQTELSKSPQTSREQLLSTSYKQCPVEIDPATKRALIVPSFSLSPSKLCQFNNNKQTLSALAKNGCKKSKLPPYKTTLRAVDGNTLIADNSHDEFSGFITSISESLQKAKDDITYVITILRPTTMSSPLSMTEENVRVRQKGKKYYLLPKYETASQGVEIDISNEPSNNVNLRGAKTTNPQGFLDSKFKSASRCWVASQISKLPQYQSSSQNESRKRAGSR